MIERSIDDITSKLLTPAPLEEDEKPAAEEAEGEGDEARAESPPAEPARDANASKAGKGAPAEAAPEGEEEAEEEQKEEWLADVVENDYLEKAGMKPPKDPEGDDTLHPDLILTTDRLMDILEKAINIT